MCKTGACIGAAVSIKMSSVSLANLQVYDTAWAFGTDSTILYVVDVR